MKRLPLLFLLAGLAGFVFAVVHLFQLRFASGDIYPPYSSLRADPLGVKAFYQSLESLLGAQRNFQPVARLGEGRATTLFYLGLHADALNLDRHQLRDLERFVTTGGRLVISLYPSYQAPRSTRSLRPFASEERRTNQAPRDLPGRRLPAPPSGDESGVSLEKRWGFSVGFVPWPQDQTDTSAAGEARHASDAMAALPDAVRWHTSVVLTNLDPAWRVVYARAPGGAVVAERDFDQGTLVLVTDSYFFSNEALQQEPQPALLTWLVGPARRALFDETHFGLAETPGVATLLRKYRLHGLLAALLLLATLFVWKNAVSLVPAASAGEGADQSAIQGKQASAGLVNLLRRNISPARVLDLCWDEWKKSCAHGRNSSRLEQVRAIVETENAKPSKERQPVTAYRRLSEILARRI